MIFLLILLTNIPSAKPIIGGFTVNPGDPKWRFTVQVHFNQTFRCTGSAIADYFVLTAAHCLTGAYSQPYLTTIVADPGFINQHIEDTYPGFRHRALFASVHPSFTSQELGGYHHYDLGLIKVMIRLPYTITLHRAWVSLELGSMCHYAGWGGNAFNLQQMRTWVYNIEDDKIQTLESGERSAAEEVNKTVLFANSNSVLFLGRFWKSPFVQNSKWKWRRLLSRSVGFWI